MGTERHGASVWTLLLLLHIGQSETRDAEDVCDARVNGTKCYGALGGTIEIRLMDNVSATFRCVWRKKNNKAFEWKHNSGKIELPDFKNRCSFNNRTGIIQIQNLIKNDSDSYVLEFYDKDGKLTYKMYHEITIEAPVFSVRLEYQCLPKGLVRATCVPQEGDNPVYNWTLNGQTLTDSELLSKNAENNITLRQNKVGPLRCSVNNFISKEVKEINISTCGYIFINCTLNGTEKLDWVYKANNSLCIEQTTAPSITTFTNQSVLINPPRPTAKSKYLPILAGILAALLITVVAFICFLKKCKKKRAEKAEALNKDEDQDQELTYADVRVLRQPDRRPQTSVGEVVYGDVKFSKQSPNMSLAEDNACIYARVRS